MSVLPDFRYHPDPISTGAVVESGEQCRCCGEARGFIYTGPVYARERLDRQLCPWCIADGSAAERIRAEFVDVIGDRAAEQVTAEDLAELTRRTVAFSGWQQPHWLFHCNTPMAYQGATELTDEAREHQFKCVVCSTADSYADGT